MWTPGQKKSTGTNRVAPISRPPQYHALWGGEMSHLEIKHKGLGSGLVVRLGGLGTGMKGLGSGEDGFGVWVKLKIIMGLLSTLGVRYDIKKRGFIWGPKSGN